MVFMAFLSHFLSFYLSLALQLARSPFPQRRTFHKPMFLFMYSSSYVGEEEAKAQVKEMLYHVYLRACSTHEF